MQPELTFAGVNLNGQSQSEKHIRARNPHLLDVAAKVAQENAAKSMKVANPHKEDSISERINKGEKAMKSRRHSGQ
jgi:hypothetical protein